MKTQEWQVFAPTQAIQKDSSLGNDTIADDAERKAISAHEDRIRRWIGMTLEGRYHILDVIGEGGMGVVYLAKNVRIGREVAIKLVNTCGDGTAGIRRLEREARTVALVGHENIVGILDFGALEDGSAFLVMEHLRGETVENRLKRVKRIPFEVASNIVTQAAYALEMAHSLGVTHRDVKPANLFLCRERERNDVVKVLDFGIASLRPSVAWEADADADVEFDSILGTPGYLSPEQARCERTDSRSDVFSLGVTFYEMLSGESPFWAETPNGRIYRTLHDDPPLIGTKVANLPFKEEIETLLQQALMKDPQKRLSSMRAFRSMLIEVRSRLGKPIRREADRLGDATRIHRRQLTGWVTTSGTRTVVELAGVLNESADFDAISERVVGPEVRIKLGKVSHINSIGSMRWTDWLCWLLERNYMITLHECSPILVHQASINASFFQGLSVASFFAPYHCVHCDYERLVLIKTNVPSAEGLGPRHCDACGHPMELDDVEENYTMFLRGGVSNRERRRFTRHDATLPVTVEWPEEEAHHIYLTNVSLGGAFLMMLKPPPRGTVLTLAMQSNSQESFPLIHARVVHVQRDPISPHSNGCGVIFVDQNTTLVESIEKTIALLNAANREKGVSTWNQERRQHVRVNVNLVGDLKFQTQRVPVEISNLSLSGALIAFKKSASPTISLNDAVTLVIPHHTQSADLTLEARIVRIDRDPLRYALAFVKIEHHAEIRIEALILSSVVSE